MQSTRTFCAGMALAVFTAFTAIAAAGEDELDVTMEVLDSVTDLDGQVLEMAETGVEGEPAVSDAQPNDGEGGAKDAPAREPAAQMPDEFQRHEDYVSGADDENFGDESKFEDDEHVDLDMTDEPMEPDVEPEPEAI